MATLSLNSTVPAVNTGTVTLNAVNFIPTAVYDDNPTEIQN